MKKQHAPQIPRLSKGSKRHKPARNTTPTSQKALAGDGYLVGRHAVEMALTVGRRQVHEVFLAASAPEVKAFQEKFPLAKVQTTSRALLDKQFPEMAHNGIAARVGSLPQPTLEELLAEAPGLIVVLDHVTDPHNVGAILRSCAAFGVGGLVVTERHSAGLTQTVAKSAAGGLEVIPFVTVGNLNQALEKMQQEGYTTFGMAGDAPIPYTQPDYKGKTVIVMGSEGEGLRRLTKETCDELIHIPMSPNMESLNVSNATAVVLSHIWQQNL